MCVDSFKLILLILEGILVTLAVRNAWDLVLVELDVVGILVPVELGSLLELVVILVKVPLECINALVQV